MNYYLLKKYLNYILFSKHKNGHGIHSPYVFDFLTETIEDFTPYYCYSDIEEIRTNLLKDNTIVYVSDYGAGSKVFKSNNRKISDLAKYSLSSPKYCQLLFRIINRIKPNNIIELGTSLGISTLYFSKYSLNSKVNTIEASEQIAKIALNNFKLLKCENIKLINSTFDNSLKDLLNSLSSVDFVFIDGNHTKKSTINSFEIIKHFANNETVIVFDDIYWSKEMTEAWYEIKRDISITISIDLFKFGIVFFNKKLQKQDYTIRF